eukprot:TRINITY_DN5267_c0_g1_i1.p2 TRINITY_DN5267_c0_g1~~TRINITY_DN5267_c0_g1_i1.p2  ORF type:complete len:145 (+),score=1.35 TRINITY_DN5267_c0_g1_i1:432-866(+)
MFNINDLPEVPPNEIKKPICKKFLGRTSHIFERSPAKHWISRRRKNNLSIIMNGSILRRTKTIKKFNSDISIPSHQNIPNNSSQMLILPSAMNIINILQTLSSTFFTFNWKFHDQLCYFFERFHANTLYINAFQPLIYLSLIHI